MRILKVQFVPAANTSDVARRFPIDRYTAVGDTAALAYVMTSMHRRGCSLPILVSAAAAHAHRARPLALSAFSVVDQVDSGQLLLEQLVREEARIFAHAFAIVRTMLRLRGWRARRSVVLLPELPRVPTGPTITQRVGVTTSGRRKSNDLSRAPTR